MKKLIKTARGFIYLIIMAVISVVTVLLPELAREEAVGKTIPPSSTPYFFVGVLSIPIFIALWLSLKFLKQIEENKAFSELSIKVLKYIEYCLIVFDIWIVLGVIILSITVRLVDPTEEVVPIFTLGFIFTFVTSVVAIFVSVLQKLLKEAIEIKSENDLTV
jgi:hypothetical protein